MAWHYKQYARDQAPDDRGAYAEAEVAARACGVGLWRDVAPVPPCTFMSCQPKIILFGESYALL